MDKSTDSALREPDLLALLDTAAQLNTVETLDEVLTNILELAGSLSRSAAGSVILHDEARNGIWKCEIRSNAGKPARYRLRQR